MNNACVPRTADTSVVGRFGGSGGSGRSYPESFSIRFTLLGLRYLELGYVRRAFPAGMSVRATTTAFRSGRAGSDRGVMGRTASKTNLGFA